MTTIVYDNLKNGEAVHYYTGTGDQCHAGVIQGGCTITDGIPDSTDLIQLDAVSLGVIVPVVRNDVAYDPELSGSPSFHFVGECTRT